MANRDAVGLAGTRALHFAERAAFRKAFHVVVMAFLGTSNAYQGSHTTGACVKAVAIC